jgi:PRTRC genetic system protein A
MPSETEGQKDDPMSSIPVYVKTDAAATRPDDPVFYWLTQNGTFLCRNHPFFSSDVPTRRPVRSLAAHAPAVSFRYPRVKTLLLETVIGFFHRVYQLHHSEAVVLLIWDMVGARYRLLVPEQEAGVWMYRDGTRSPEDVRYRTPVLPPGQLLVGDLHSHGDMDAYASWTDQADERYRDGIHGVVGRISREPPEFHLELAVDGHRFPLPFGQVFEGYGRRRAATPRTWLDRVKVKTLTPRSWAWWSGRRDDDHSRNTI